jgi:hypothetical protein
VDENGTDGISNSIATSIAISTSSMPEPPDPATQQREELKRKRKEDRDLTEPQVRAAWLKPYHFKKGQSGNPSGLSKSGARAAAASLTPITEAYVWVLDQPYPPSQRVKLETMLGINLRKDLTFAQAIALGRALGAVTDTATADSITNRVEGLLRQSLEMSGAGGAPLMAPVLITQYVEIARDGTPVKIIDAEAEAKPSDDETPSHT